MAYKGYEFTNTAATRAAFFAALQAFLIDVGWELHHSVSATVKVYRSNGESGQEPYGYVWIDAGTSTYIQFAVYQYWNSATGVGSRLRYAFSAASSQITTGACDASAKSCIFAGDKNFVLILYDASRVTANAGVGFGHVPGRFDPALATAMGTAGTPGTLLVSSSAKMGVGKVIQICGAEGVDKLSVLSAPASDSVIVASLPRNYGTGAVIGSPASVFGIALKDQSYYSNFYPTGFYGDAGTSVGSAIYAIVPMTAPSISSVLMHFNNMEYSSPIFVANPSASSPGILVGMFHSGFLTFRLALAGNDCMLANIDGSLSPVGAATGGTSTTLVDSAKSWTVDSQIGRTLVLTGGTGASQVRMITDNDGTSLTVGYAWRTTPDATSEYKICDYLYRIVAATLNTSAARTGVLITHTQVPA